MLIGVDPDSLTVEQNQKSLKVVNLIKLKRSGKLKYGMCANGAHHCRFVSMEEANLPTITMEEIRATMVIDAYEYRNVATFDIPGAYLQTYLPKETFTLLLLEVKFVEIMCDINAEYKQHVRFKDGRNTFYIRIIKAIYGMIEYALLWYKLYVSVLKDVGL